MTREMRKADARHAALRAGDRSDETAVVWTLLTSRNIDLRKSRLGFINKHCPKREMQWSIRKDTRRLALSVSQYLPNHSRRLHLSRCHLRRGTKRQELSFFDTTLPLPPHFFSQCPLISKRALSPVFLSNVAEIAVPETKPLEHRHTRGLVLNIIGIKSKRAEDSLHEVAIATSGGAVTFYPFYVAYTYPKHCIAFKYCDTSILDRIRSAAQYSSGNLAQPTPERTSKSRCLSSR